MERRADMAVAGIAQVSGAAGNLAAELYLPVLAATSAVLLAVMLACMLLFTRRRAPFLALAVAGTAALGIWQGEVQTERLAATDPRSAALRAELRDRCRGLEADVAAGRVNRLSERHLATVVRACGGDGIAAAARAGTSALRIVEGSRSAPGGARTTFLSGVPREPAAVPMAVPVALAR